MTDPTGIGFLSYKRERANEAKLLVDIFRDHGILMWQDVDDLSFGTTETEIIQVLSKPETAFAVLLVTPEVEQSHMIREVEVHNIFSRVANDNGFYVVPIAAGALDYGQVAQVLGSRTGIVSIEDYNIVKADIDPLDENFSQKLVAMVLDRRLKCITYSLNEKEPVKIQLNTQSRPLPKSPGYALNVDFHHRFNGRQAKEGAWDNYIKPAFANIVKALSTQTPHRNIEFSGKISIPTAVALGTAFLSLTGLNASWEQKNINLPDELWGLHIPRQNSGFTPTIAPQSPQGTDYALLISVTTDVMDDFRSTQSHLPLRALVHIAPKERGTNRLELTAAAAVDVAQMAVDALRQAWSHYGRRGTVHLFIAAPVGLAFMIGQQLNTFDVIQTYEYIASGGYSYEPAAQLQPSG